jgi:hypothetical protein
MQRITFHAALIMYLLEGTTFFSLGGMGGSDFAERHTYIKTMKLLNPLKSLHMNFTYS